MHIPLRQRVAANIVFVLAGGFCQSNCTIRPGTSLTWAIVSPWPSSTRPCLPPHNMTFRAQIVWPFRGLDCLAHTDKTDKTVPQITAPSSIIRLLWTESSRLCACLSSRSDKQGGYNSAVDLTLYFVTVCVCVCVWGGGGVLLAHRSAWDYETKPFEYWWAERTICTKLSNYSSATVTRHNRPVSVGFHVVVSRWDNVFWSRNVEIASTLWTKCVVCLCLECFNTLNTKCVVCLCLECFNTRNTKCVVCLCLECFNTLNTKCVVCLCLECFNTLNTKCVVCLCLECFNTLNTKCVVCLCLECFNTRNTKCVVCLCLECFNTRNTKCVVCLCLECFNTLTPLPNI